MIVKKIKTQRYTKPKAWQIADLVDYIRNVRDRRPDTKVAYTGHRGFFADTHTAQKLEMIALASESVQSKMPVTHWLFSWRENEQPSAAHVEDIADIFLEKMGLEGHQVVYALHNDTDNYHMHLAVNRTHPMTHKVVQPHKGFDINAAHKILAHIEHKQGWCSEKGQRYTVLEDGSTARVLKQDTPAPKPKAANFERATGEKSAQRIAQEQGYELICKAKTWQELHEYLAQKGLRFEKKGSGAVIFVPTASEEVAVKASSVHRTCSMKNLCARLGEYVPADISAITSGSPKKEEASIVPAPISNLNHEEWLEYQTEKAQHFHKKAVNKARIHYKQALFQAKQEYRKSRVSTLPKMAKHGLPILNIARYSLKQQHQERIQKLRAAVSQETTFPCFEDWLHKRGYTKQAQLWRYRLRAEQALELEHIENKAHPPIQDSSALTCFEQYAHAVNAEKFRVTCIQMAHNGDKKVFILGKKEGALHGFTAEEMRGRMDELLRLQKRGENIYYTPLSTSKHHILIDDMSAESLERFQNDGFTPAVILESSPHNYQCILTVPKLKSSYNRDISNRLTERLNKEYGDKKLSGCIHPHRAPAFENRKPKHSNADGSYPQVKLLYAEQKICRKAYELTQQLEREHASRERQRQIQMPSRHIPQSTPEATYIAHWQNIRQHITVEDYSRVDSMIALRMRATGHSSEAVAHAVQNCAPNIRESEQRRNWPDYAQRTARYAFGVAGDLDLRKNEKYVGYWQRIEDTLQSNTLKKLHRYYM